MSEEKLEEQESSEVEETLDFDSSESRLGFLKSQLNDLLDGINNTYGSELMEELLKRLEKTIEDYNVEVSGLMGRLKAGKIFQDDEEEEEDDDLQDDFAPASDDDEDLADKEAEDADIIKRMRARISHD